MKRVLYSLRALGVVSILVMGTSVGSAHADNNKSPLRGRWSSSQVNEITPAVGGAPVTIISTMTVDESGGVTGHSTLNSPCTVIGPACLIPNGLALDFEGTITANPDGTAVATFVTPAFGNSTVNYACVLMEKQGDCFQEFRCVNTDPNGIVTLAEFKRQLAGSCK
jgi:hypothetical protein